MEWIETVDGISYSYIFSDRMLWEKIFFYFKNGTLSDREQKIMKSLQKVISVKELISIQCFNLRLKFLGEFSLAKTWQWLYTFYDIENIPILINQL